MNKQNNLALFAFLGVGIFSFSTQIVFAQKAETPQIEQSKQPCSGEKFEMPASISVGNEAFTSYLKLATLPVKERRIAYRELSNEQKASFFKVQFALQLVKRPSMTKEQKDFILDAISKVSPDLYDSENPENVRKSEDVGQQLENKAMGVFTPKDASEILAALFADKTQDATLVQKYDDLLKFGNRERRRVVRQMPVLDRVNIWKTQLAFHLATGKFSKAQNEFISEMLVSISPATFEPRNLTKEEEEIAFNAIMAKILAHFSRAESFAIFEEIGIQKTVPDIRSNLAPSWCDCRWYCGNGETCRTIGCVIFPECGPTGTWECQYVCV